MNHILTQCELQTILRNNHKIFINVNPVLYAGDMNPDYYYPTHNNSLINTSIRCKTWEEALEIGLQYGLTLIITK